MYNLLLHKAPGFVFNEIHFEKENLKGSCDHHPMGGGMQAKASKIVNLCYYLSILYLINCCKNIQNIKNCLLRPVPPGGGGVWCDTPVPSVRTTPHQMV